MFLPSQICCSCSDGAHLWWIGDDLRSSAGVNVPDGDPWRSGGVRVPFLEFYADRETTCKRCYGGGIDHIESWKGVVGGSTLGDRLWNVTWIKTLRNGILDELLFDLLLFVPISEVLLNFLNPAAPSLSLLIRIDGEERSGVQRAASSRSTIVLQVALNRERPPPAHPLCCK
uniref:Uncharacterized protein n=1 Tax=Ananas comosus var. bracteatus TaxID=296719 RepID=A0A6V7Q2U4_ANACO|nr:unnamed protein product [Ananas comosus var. bracteatus]